MSPGEEDGPRRRPGPGRRRGPAGGLRFHPFRGTRVRTGPRHGGAVRSDGADAFYVLEQRRDGVLLQRGVIGAVDLAGPWHGVLRHEDVLPAGVDLHHRITRLTGGCAEPVLLSHRGGPEAAAALARAAAGPPDWEALGEDRTVHRYWACTDPEHQAAIRAGTTGRTALIADGHHRFAAAQRYRVAFGGRPGPWDRVLALLVDSVRHPLRLTAIDRLVPGLDPVRAAAEAARVARVAELPAPPRRPVPGELVLAGAGRCWSITAPRSDAVRSALAGRPAAWRSIDVAVLNHLFLTRVWRMPVTGDRVRHLHAGDGAAPPPPGGGSLLLVAPPSEESVWRLAEAGVRMPAKSTSFGPKPLPRQVVYRFAAQPARPAQPALPRAPGVRAGA